MRGTEAQAGRGKAVREIFFCKRATAVGFAVTQRRIADAGQFVGEGAGCFVVIGASLDGEGPLSQTVDGLAGANGDRGAAKNGTGAVGKEDAKVAIAAFGDMPEMTPCSGRIFFRRDTEPGYEVTGIAEVSDVAGSRGDHGRAHDLIIR